MEIPAELRLPYAISNGVAAGLLLLSWPRPRWVRWASVVIFALAAGLNTRMAIVDPGDYQNYAPLATSEWYRELITGWFRTHARPVVLAIALGQLIVAGLLTRPGRARTVGVLGGVVFLLAIAPLGVGSAFPFSLTYGLALALSARDRPSASRPSALGAG